MIMLDYFSVKGVIMKKRITRFILILCLLSLTACGKKAPQKTSNFETKINNFTQKLLDMFFTPEQQESIKATFNSLVSEIVSGVTKIIGSFIK